VAVRRLDVTHHHAGGLEDRHHRAVTDDQRLVRPATGVQAVRWTTAVLSAPRARKRTTRTAESLGCRNAATTGATSRRWTRLSRTTLARSATYPLLVVHDGGDFLRYEPKAMCRLLVRKSGLPLAVVWQWRSVDHTAGLDNGRARAAGPLPVTRSPSGPCGGPVLYPGRPSRARSRRVPPPMHPSLPVLTSGYGPSGATHAPRSR
jgi:hypothetical protein